MYNRPASAALSLLPEVEAPCECSVKVLKLMALGGGMEFDKMDILVNKPKTQRGKDTLDKICMAAEQVFYEKGYYNSSIGDITKLAHVASGTFYIYFDGKYSLYKYLLLQYSHIIRKHISMSIVGVKNRREAERLGLKVWLEFIREHKYMYNIIWESLYIDRQLYIDYYENFSRSYVKQLDEAKGKGELADVDTKILSYVLMGISNFIGLNWVLFRENDDLDYVVDEVMKIFDENLFEPMQNNWYGRNIVKEKV